jgi:hypothetical protein
VARVMFLWCLSRPLQAAECVEGVTPCSLSVWCMDAPAGAAAAVRCVGRPRLMPAALRSGLLPLLVWRWML